jgi:ABC-type multidrug transport system ATPase subunit
MRRVDLYLDRVGLLETRKKKMRELSKGMQQKVQIAAVLLS